MFSVANIRRFSLRASFSGGNFRGEGELLIKKAGLPKKCYDNIQPKYVIAAFEKFVKDEKYLDLLRKVANSMNSLPLGNYTSAWFENLLLLEMDTAIRQAKGINYYLRYVDDFISLSANKKSRVLCLATFFYVMPATCHPGPRSGRASPYNYFNRKCRASSS